MNQPTTPTAPAAPPAQSSPPPAPAVDGSFGIPLGASAPAEPTPKPTVPTELLTQLPGGSKVFPGLLEPVKPTEKGPLGNTLLEQPQGGFSIEEFVSKHIADPETLFQGDGRKITQFKELRGLFEGATRDLAAAQLELSQLRASRPAAAPGDGVQLPETEAVQKLTAEIEALKPAAQKWQEIEARQALAQNPAFRNEFDAPRADILREMEATAAEIGLEQEDVEEFLSLDSEYKQARWIKDNVEDDVAAQLYREKGRQFLSLTSQAKSVLESKDPVAALREWEDYNNAFATKFAAKLEESAARELQSATSKVVSELSAGGDPFFATDSGKAVLADLNRRASEGRGFAADEVVQAVAMARSAEAYQALAASLKERAEAAEAELARLRGLSPVPRPPAPSSGPQAPARDLYGFGPTEGGPAPMIRLSQIGR